MLNFRSINSVDAGGIVVGRLDDFDPTRDHIRIDGANLDLSDLPSNMKIVLHNGQLEVANAPLQQWLVIKNAAGGYIIYTLEGARVDPAGGMHGGQEAHFLESADSISTPGKPGAKVLEIINLFETQASAVYVNPYDYVPYGSSAQGGIVVNDDDSDGHDLMNAVLGSANGDLIAAGLNNDTVNAGTGNDQVWGGSGHDTVNGEAGNDSLMGNFGNDSVNGGDGNDLITYHSGADTIAGGAGVDTLVFAGTSAMIVNLNASTNGHGMTITGVENLTGASGNDDLDGDGGNNLLIGNSGNDNIVGWAGNDSSLGGNGNDLLWGQTGNDTISGGNGNDTLLAHSGTDSLTGGAGDDLFRYQNAQQGADIITDFDSVAGNNDRFSIYAAGFGGGLVAGSLNAANFRANATGLAQDSNDLFIFETDTNELYFDVDGTGAGASVLIATLQSTAPDVTAGDIWLY